MFERHRPETEIEYADLEWAYRALLGREPDGIPDLLDRWRQIAPDVRTLVDFIARSDEFAGRTSKPAALFTYSDDAPTQEAILPVLRQLAPFTVEGFSSIRLGNDADGGYVMLDDFEGVHVAYSLGISTDVAWDDAIADRNIDVYQYDHTIGALPHRRDRFFWKKIGIEGVVSDNPHLDTLDNLIAANRHSDVRDMVLKCDIEGAEWEMLAHMAPDSLGRFRQIVIEIHFLNNLGNPAFLPVATKAIANLTKSHRVVHVHANNFAAYSIVGGIPLPSVVELTLARVDEGKVFRPSKECYPTRLDQPCMPGRADYRLGTFRF